LLQLNRNGIIWKWKKIKMNTMITNIIYQIFIHGDLYSTPNNQRFRGHYTQSEAYTTVKRMRCYRDPQTRGV
jgi:hypothetical protein